MRHPNFLSGHRATVAARARQRGDRMSNVMSAIGPKQTWVCALHMSAFRGKADIPVCESPLLQSLLGESGHDVLHRKCPLVTQSGHLSASGARVFPRVVRDTKAR